MIHIWKPVYSDSFASDADRSNDISVNANLISVRLKSKRQRINKKTLYLRDIWTLLVAVVFKHIDQI